MGAEAALFMLEYLFRCVSFVEEEPGLLLLFLPFGAACAFLYWLDKRYSRMFYTASEDESMDAHELLRLYRAGERDFVLVSLPQADLRGADLYHANLSGADLSLADLRDANLVGARLRRADLAWTDLRGANLAGADLGRADLHQADLRGADLSYANLEDSNVTGEQLVQAASLIGAILPDGRICA